MQATLISATICEKKGILPLEYSCVFVLENGEELELNFASEVEEFYDSDEISDAISTLFKEELELNVIQVIYDEENENFAIINTDSSELNTNGITPFDEDGYNNLNIDVNNFTKKGNNIFTKKKHDEDGFDKDGALIKENVHKGFKHPFEKGGAKLL